MLIVLMAYCWTSEDGVPIVGSDEETVEAVVNVLKKEKKGVSTTAKSGSFKQGDAQSGTGDISTRLVVKGEGTAEASGSSKPSKTRHEKGPTPTVLMSVVKISLAELALLTVPETTKVEVYKTPARRGEHVINNNILKLFQSIVDDYIDKVGHGKNYNQLIRDGKLKPGMKVVEACERPMAESFKMAISKELVAHVQEQKQYIDANAVAYGTKIQEIRGGVVTYMLLAKDVLANPPDPPKLTNAEKIIEMAVEEFLAREYFLDPQALSIWLKKGGKMKRYEEVKKEVIRMFRLVEYHYNVGEVIEWVKELERAINA